MHCQFVQFLLLFHYNNGCMNEAQYYAIRTWPVLLFLFQFEFLQFAGVINICHIPNQLEDVTVPNIFYAQ
jgi:hypothetical protein